MSAMEFDRYRGDGRQVPESGKHRPLFQSLPPIHHPRGYLATKGLRDAVNIALALQQPLLVTGDPGTGKTQLAWSIAYELDLPPPLVFRTKTTSTATDLLYRYDSLRHFQDIELKSAPLPPESYISYEALGQAILLSKPPAEVHENLPESLRDKGPVQSVVLVDEIDKAPRDFPNDLLTEVETMSFRVKETNQPWVAGEAERPILILTSNSEKNLPDAFLRRCVFYYIPFPDREMLRTIVQSRLQLGRGNDELIEHALVQFEKIRSLPLRKSPATAELQAWIRILAQRQIDPLQPRPEHLEALGHTYSVLGKSKDDIELMCRDLEKAAQPSDG